MCLYQIIKTLYPEVCFLECYRSDSVMNWTVVYNGSDSIWTISDLPTGEMYIFRVAAHNLIGWSNYSGNSTPFLLPTIAKGIILVKDG